MADTARADRDIVIRGTVIVSAAGAALPSIAASLAFPFA
jgi:hypothetical protein